MAPRPRNGNENAYREGLYAAMAFGLPGLRTFAWEWLEELWCVCCYGTEESLGLPLKQ